MTQGTYPSPSDGRYPYGYPVSEGAGVGGMDLYRAIRAIVHRWWYPVLGALLLFGLAWDRLPEDVARYRAVSVVRLDGERQALAGSVGGGRGENVRLPELTMSQVHVIRSQAVLGAVVDKLELRLRTVPEVRRSITGFSVDAEAPSAALRLEFGPERFVVRAGSQTASGLYGIPVEIAGVNLTLDSRPPVDTAWINVVGRQAAIQRLSSIVSAAPRDRTAIIDIGVTTLDAAEAVSIANAVAEEYQFHNVAGVLEAARRRREFVESQWQGAEARYEAAQQRLNWFRTARESNRSPEQLRQQQSALVAAEAERQRLGSERRVFQSFLERVGQLADDAIYQELRTLVMAPGITPSPLLSQIYAQLTDYQQERARLLAAGRSPTHPDVERLGRMIQSARSAVVEAARTHLASVDLRIAHLDEQRERGAAALRTLPTAEAEELALSQEVSSTRALADALNQEYQRARMAEAVDVGQASILDYATSAFPLPAGRRSQKLVIAFLLGIFLGSSVALGLELRDGAIRWRGEIDELGEGVPALGIVPSLTEVAPAWKRMFGRNGKPVAGSAKNGKSQLVASDFHTLGAEAYRTLRTNLSFVQREGRLGTLVITSAQSSEGKSTTASNLAVSMARQDRRVILVDCDLRRPRQHQIFATPESPGFSDLLTMKAELHEAIHATAVPGLSLIPRGKFDENAAEALGGDRMREILALLREQYDSVIIDTPPVLVAADAAAVASATDGTLLVVRAGRTPKDAARRTLQQLHVVGANVVGFVLNDPDTVSSRYGEYIYSRHYYAVKT
jgi:polysaccharide biosynthesis transport protein